MRGFKLVFWLSATHLDVGPPELNSPSTTLDLLIIRLSVPGEM